MTKTLSHFALMVCGALFGAVLGGAFAVGLGFLSPEFINDLFPTKKTEVVRYAGALGAVVGLFLGFGGMVFALFLQAINRKVREM